MRRSAVVLALVACEGSSPPAPPAATAPPAWVYAPAPVAWPLPPVVGRIGRAQAPAPGLPGGLTGALRFPLRLPTTWAVPGPGPARAVVYGLEGVVPAVELVDVDAGIVRWRDTTTCSGPVVGVTADALVCAVVDGVRGIRLDGKAAWSSDAPFIAMTDDLVVVGPTGLAVMLDARTGEEVGRVTLPPGILAESVVASCGDAGRELFATGPTGELVRIADIKGQSQITWKASIGAVDRIDACAGEHVVITQREGGAGRLIALARATGAETGRVEGARGAWPARDGSPTLEIATAAGVRQWPRALTTSEALPLPPLGELLDARGDLRLVRTSPRTAVVLDRAGVRAYLPLAVMGAVLGDTAIVGASWVGSEATSVWRVGLPERYRRGLRLPGTPGAVALPAELRDLPPATPLRLDGAIALPDTAPAGVALVAIDPVAPGVVYAVAPGASDGAIAAMDLGSRTWTWQRSDGCGPGTPVGLVVTDAVVACGVRGAAPGTSTVRATTRAGHAAWSWDADTVDALQAAGDVVVVSIAERATILDAATGRELGHLASDDGGALPVTAVVADGTTLVIAAERGRVVARLPRVSFVPAWSVAVDGVVRAIHPAPGGVLVELEDGDAVHLDALTGAPFTVPGLGLAWLPFADLLAGTTAGGPIPGPPVPRSSLLEVTRAVIRRGAPPPDDNTDAPRLWTPIPPPPSLGPSWQLTLYDPTGGVRARNDYALVGAVAPATARGPAGSLIVVSAGRAADGTREVLVIDPRTGDPLRRVVLPADAPAGALFSTIVDGSPVAGVVLAGPLRVALY